MTRYKHIPSGNTVEVIGNTAYLMYPDNSYNHKIPEWLVKGKDWVEIKEKRQKLFTTEDGVDIYKGYEGACFVDEKFNLHELAPISNGFNYKDIREKNFSTKQAAEHYILINKPCLSLKEVAAFWDEDDNLFRLYDLKDYVKNHKL